MEKWVVAAKKADFQKIAGAFDIDPVTARLIRNRDMETMEDIRMYLHGTMKDVPSPWFLKDVRKAVEILKEKIRNGSRIRIIGDYDIDGVTATYILLTAFRRLNAVVDTCIPDRITDGYGIHEHLITQAAEEGIDTIVTCDNGIAGAEEIRYAKERGMTVIVTDHHEVPYREAPDGTRSYVLPPADAVCNPKRPDCPYPWKNICGAVVAWKLIQALYEACDVPREEADAFLEFAAIATVGDVMDLQGENRILVKEGLKKLADTGNTGLRALLRATGLEGSTIRAYHIGFVLGPCINASGRLDTATRSLKLFQEKDPAEAARLAGDLKALNESRKAMTEQGKEAAVRQVEEEGLLRDKVLVVYLPDTHESLAGIIAGRLREQYHRPAFVLTGGERLVKGSGRSVECYSMYDELTKCRELLTAFGGHPMAAGLSLEESQVDAFRKKLNTVCTLTEEDLVPKITIDVPMPISYVHEKLIRELELLEPFGKGNTRPLFAQKNLQVIGGRIFGKNQNVARFLLSDAHGQSAEAVYFGDAKTFLEAAKDRSDLAVTYYPEIQTWQGKESVWLIVRNYY